MHRLTRSLAHSLTRSLRLSPNRAGSTLFHLTIASSHWIDAVHQTRICTSSPPAPSPKSYRFKLPACASREQPSHFFHLRAILTLGCTVAQTAHRVPPPSFLPPRASNTVLACVPELPKLLSVAFPVPAIHRHPCAIPHLHTTPTIPSRPLQPPGAIASGAELHPRRSHQRSTY